MHSQCSSQRAAMISAELRQMPHSAGRAGAGHVGKQFGGSQCGVSDQWGSNQRGSNQRGSINARNGNQRCTRRTSICVALLAASCVEDRTFSPVERSIVTCRLPPAWCCRLALDCCRLDCCRTVDCRRHRCCRLGCCRLDCCRISAAASIAGALNLLPLYLIAASMHWCLISAGLIAAPLVLPP